MEPQYELSPLELFYQLVDQFREHGPDFVRSRVENEFEPGTLHNLSGFGYPEYNPQQTLRLGQIEHIIETVRVHYENEKETTCLFCGEHTHLVDSCCDPRIGETWQQLLEEVNQDDLEDEDFDSVMAMLEHEVSREMLITLSVQYGKGHFMEKLSLHKYRIIIAIKQFIEELRANQPNISFIDSSTQCSVHLNERTAIEDTFCQECPICYNEDLKTIQMSTLGCQHQFCRPCLVRHIEKNQLKCPMCRTPVNQIVTRQREDYDALCAVLTARVSNNNSDDDNDSVSDLDSIDENDERILFDEDVEEEIFEDVEEIFTTNIYNNGSLYMNISPIQYHNTISTLDYYVNNE